MYTIIINRVPCRYKKGDATSAIQMAGNNRTYHFWSDMHNGDTMIQRINKEAIRVYTIYLLISEIPLKPLMTHPFQTNFRFENYLVLPSFHPMYHIYTLIIFTCGGI